jgi:microcystin-dependent protein
MPSHDHGVTDPGHNHSYVNTPNDQSVFGIGESAADQADSTQSTGNAITNISIQHNGGGAAHNNMQPFVVIRYLIKY